MTLIDRYIAAATARSFALAAALLLTLFSLLEFVEQLSSVGQNHYHLRNALIYVVLTVPSRLLQVTPASVLLACLLALGSFARSSELIALQSLAVSKTRIIGALLKLGLPLCLGLFLLAQFIIPPAYQLAQSQRGAALPSSAAIDTGNGFWATSNRQYLSVQQLRDSTTPADIDIYQFAADGSLQRYLHADTAVIRPDKSWLLTNVTQKRVVASQFITRQFPTLPWASFISPQQMRLLMLPAEDMPPVALHHLIRQLQHRNQPAARYRQAFWAMVSIPFTITAMILLAAAFSFGPVRTHGTGRQITIGAIAGILFTLVQQITAHLGLLLNLDAAAIELAPPLALAALAGQLLRR